MLYYVVVVLRARNGLKEAIVTVRRGDTMLDRGRRPGSRGEEGGSVPGACVFFPV